MTRLPQPQLDVLKTAIQNDPTLTNKSHVEIAAILNSHDRDVPAETLDVGKLVANLTIVEHNSIQPTAKDYLRTLAARDFVPLTDTMRANLDSMVPAGSSARARIEAVQKRKGSRLDELNLPSINESDVADALRGE